MDLDISLPRLAAIARVARLALVGLGACALVACGGDSGHPADGGPPVVTPPPPAAPTLTITQQPAGASVTAGTAANFAVAATCSSGTLDVQWQRRANATGPFAAVDGATAASLAVPTALADDGAQFRAALDCGGQSATTSAAATLTVTPVAVPTALRLDPLPVTGLRKQGEIGRVGAVAVNADGSVTFTADIVVGRLSADLTSITRVAGPGNGAIVDGPAATAGFSQLHCAATDAAGNTYFCDNSTIRRMTPDGTVTTFVGTTSNGSADGTGSAAGFNTPMAIAMGPDGDLYVADAGNYNVRRVTTAGVVTTYAGPTNGQFGYRDGAPGQALFQDVQGIAVAANGDVLVADRGNHRIRRIARSGNGAGTVSTLAGNGLTGSGADGAAGVAVVEQPISLALRGNTLVVLQAVDLVRQVDLATGAVTTLAGTYTAYPTGFADGGRGQAHFTGGGGIAALPDGRFVVADHQAIRIVSAAGDVRTLAVAGSDDAFDTSGGVLAQAPFLFASNERQTLAVDTTGSVVVASGREVRRIAASGAVSLVAGIDTAILGMVDGPGSTAQFASVGSGIATAPDGSIYVSDAESLRRIDPAGNVTLLAGYRVTFADTSGGTPFGAVDGDAATARFQNALGLAVGPDGALYVADGFNNAIRRVDAAGNTTTWAGALGQSGTVDGPRAASRFRSPGAIAFAPDGSAYVLDTGALRKVSADGTTVSTVIGSGAFRVLAFDAAGNAFLGATDGLWELPAGASSATQLIAGGSNDAVVTGTAPHLGRIDAIAVIAPKQIAMISGYQLVKVTLP